MMGTHSGKLEETMVLVLYKIVSDNSVKFKLIFLILHAYEYGLALEKTVINVTI